MQLDVINFSYNWNNKLASKAFTTIRLTNQTKYQVGREYVICLKEKPLFNAVIIEIKKFYLDQLNEFMARIDTGYSIQETKDIILRMYKKVDFENKVLYYILLQKVEPTREIPK